MCATERRRRAFSLIEVMVAVAMATVILLVAVAAVRSASQALGILRRNAEEADLLLAGWLAAMDEADYWNANANPGYPYLKGPMSQTVSVDGGQDNPWDKRPFRPVKLLSDPSQFLPHEARAWHRGGTLVGTTPITFQQVEKVVNGKMVSQWSFTYPWLTRRDPCVISETAIPASGSQMARFPAGWAPWHLQGDWASLANCGSPAENAGLPAGAASAEACERQVARWGVFSELGHLGEMAYDQPGAINLIARPPLNRSVANIGQRQTWYDWGEVPWSFCTGAQGNPAAFSPTSFTLPAAAGERRRNYYLGMPASLASLATTTDPESMSSEGEPTTAYTNDRSGLARFLACDQNSTISARGPTAIFLPSRALAGSAGGWETDFLIDRSVVDPIRMLNDQSGGGSLSQVKGDQRMRQRHEVTTWLQPGAPADRQPDADALAAAPGRLSLSSFRTIGCGERVQLTLRVDAGRPLELRTTVLGTTYRGARMHWGWKSTIDTSLPPMGDR